MTKHEENCEAPICMDNPSDNHYWYPDEPICKKAPGSHVQQIQRRIQNQLKAGKLEHGDLCYYTLEMLIKINVIGTGTSGMNPDTQEACPILDPKYNPMKSRALES